MKNFKRSYAGLIILLLISISCSKDDTIEENPDTENPSTELGLVDITIDLPEDVDIDLSSAKLSAFLEDHEVTEGGATKALIPKGQRAFVYLSNTSGDIILMGFVSEDRPTLTIKSTLEASLYFNMGVVFQLGEVKTKFLNEFQDLPEIEPFVKEMEVMYKANPLLLKSESFTSWLKTVPEKLTSGNEAIDLKSVLITDNSSVKSGIRLIQDESDLFSVTAINFSRRRAYSFFYKTYEKKKGSNQWTKIVAPNEIGASNSLKADYGLDISPITGVTSVQGNIGDLISGNGQKLVFTNNGPVKLELSNTQTAVKYRVRVLGPGLEKRFRHKTNDEQDKLSKMEIETLVLDFVIPIITTTIGGLDVFDFTSKLDINSTIESANLLLASSSNAIDAMDEGDYVTAATEFGKGLLSNYALSEKFWRNIFNGLGKISSFNSARAEAKDLAGRFAAPITAANGLILGSDLFRIGYDIHSASSLEEFDLIVSRGKIKISPGATGIALAEEATFKAKVLDDEDIQTDEYHYNWITKGNYGNFTFNSKTDQIIYRSKPAGTLIPKNAKDTVYVEVYKNGTLVGEDSAFVNVSATKYKIRPDNLTIEGGDKVTLRIVDVKNKPIVLTDNNFRIEWSTPGNFGSFGGSKTNISSTTLNSIVYHCFDKEVKMGTELIEAKIYYIPGYTDDELNALDYDLHAQIKIENDENIKRYYVDYMIEGSPPHLNDNGIYCEYSVRNKYEFMPEDPDLLASLNKEVVSYQLIIMESVPDANPSYVGTGRTWYPENAENDLEDGKYIYRFGGTGSQGGAQGCSDGSAESYYSNLLALYNTFQGYAQVIVTLKDK